MKVKKKQKKTSIGSNHLCFQLSSTPLKKYIPPWRIIPMSSPANYHITHQNGEQDPEENSKERKRERGVTQYTHIAGQSTIDK